VFSLVLRVSEGPRGVAGAWEAAWLIQFSSALALPQALLLHGEAGPIPVPCSQSNQRVFRKTFTEGEKKCDEQVRTRGFWPGSMRLSLSPRYPHFSKSKRNSIVA
jgi:hypothetical protein